MRLILTAFLICAIAAAEAQNLRDIQVKPSDNGKIFSTLLKEIEKEHSIDFLADFERLNALTVHGIESPVRLMDYLDTYSGLLEIEKVNEHVIILIDRAILKGHQFVKPRYVVLKSDQSETLSAMVTDALAKTPLVGARVYSPVERRGTATDETGRFSLAVSISPYALVQVSFSGYDTENLIVGLSPYGDETALSVGLLQSSKELMGVTITAERINENVVSQISGLEKMSMATIKTIPTFMGEVDPIRSLTTLPGVTTAGELASGFNVRGGNVGQNLILQDGAAIYNPSHLFGFFSAFNPDIVSDVALYKGNGPANFGGRVSSVLDVALKNGSTSKHTISGGVGLISSRLTAEGPIAKGKTSYIIGGRISYCNWLLNASGNLQLQSSSAKYHDITAKILHNINDNNFITLSVYNSYDDFRLQTDSLFSWQTLNFSATWDHTFNEHLFSKFTVTQTNYLSEVQSEDEIEKFNYQNSIRGAGLKYGVTYTISENDKITAGLEGNASKLEPGKMTPSEGSFNVEPQDMQDQRSIEGAVYLQADISLGEKFVVSPGIRYSWFGRFGNESIYSYDYEHMNGRYPSIADTTTYTSGQLISQYGGLEPRISMRYLIGTNASIKASFYRGYQYLHLISNTTSTTPQDYWIASGPQLKPEAGNQYSLGYFQNFSENVYEFSVEGFYRTIDNAVDYMEGADITLNPILESGIAQGKGKTYGVEVFFKKASGRFNGWLSYTFSRSLRQFDGTGNGIVINEGGYYASAFDQPHVASVLLNYRFGARVSLSANFRYNTGRPITIPVSKFAYDVYLSVLNYSERNEYRIPDYHRLDLSLTVKDNPHKLSRYHGEFVFSIFNVYGRRNAYSVTFDRYGKARQLSILGSIFPSVSYNFSF